MAGTFDTSVVRTEEIKSVFLTYRQRSLSQQSYAVHQVGHHWEFDITTKPMTRTEWQPMISFINQQYGRFNTFSYTSKAMALPQGSLSGSTYAVTVSTAHSAGGTSVSFSGLPASAVVWKAGDFIKFSGHAKVYAIQSTSVTSSSSGGATATILPELVATLASSESVSYQNVVFTCAFKEDAPSVPVGVD